MEKVTIHRALSELKLINARIVKGIESVVPSGIQQKDKLVNNVYKLDDFEKSARENFQSVTDLIDRRTRIKSAVVLANGVTKVKIAGKEMTIADAINTKGILVLKKQLIENLRKKHNNAKATLEKNNASVDANALELAKVAVGKQGVKIGDDDAQKVIGPYIENNKFSLIDPLDIEKKIADMEKEITDFEAEVDAVLSEINATTFIEF